MRPDRDDFDALLMAATQGELVVFIENFCLEKPEAVAELRSAIGESRYRDAAQRAAAAIDEAVAATACGDLARAQRCKVLWRRANAEAARWYAWLNPPAPTSGPDEAPSESPAPAGRDAAESLIGALAARTLAGGPR